MKKILLFFVMLILVSCNCNTNSTKEAKETEEVKRFTFSYVQTEYGNEKTSVDKIEIITDTETGIQYLWVIASDRAGLCKLEGTPLPIQSDESIKYGE